jgi:hypothetical protein
VRAVTKSRVYEIACHMAASYIAQQMSLLSRQPTWELQQLPSLKLGGEELRRSDAESKVMNSVCALNGFWTTA